MVIQTSFKGEWQAVMSVKLDEKDILATHNKNKSER